MVHGLAGAHRARTTAHELADERRHVPSRSSKLALLQTRSRRHQFCEDASRHDRPTAARIGVVRSAPAGPDPSTHARPRCAARSRRSRPRSSCAGCSALAARRAPARRPDRRARHAWRSWNSFRDSRRPPTAWERADPGCAASREYDPTMLDGALPSPAPLGWGRLSPHTLRRGRAPDAARRVMLHERRAHHVLRARATPTWMTRQTRHGRSDAIRVAVSARNSRAMSTTCSSARAHRSSRTSCAARAS